MKQARGPKADGRVFKTRYIQTAYNNAVEAAKLDDVNFHTLRHTFASWAVMRGVTVKELQELLGHASLTMTMRYAHLAPEHLRTAVSRLEGLTSSQPASASAQEPCRNRGSVAEVAVVVGSPSSTRIEPCAWRSLPR